MIQIGEAAFPAIGQRAVKIAVLLVEVVEAGAPAAVLVHDLADLAVQGVQVVLRLLLVVGVAGAPRTPAHRVPVECGQAGRRLSRSCVERGGVPRPAGVQGGGLPGGAGG